jgi:hypothetical protein
MDDHEKMAYLNLLMYACSQPDGGVPDNEYELAIASGLELKWWRPTRTKAKRIRLKDEKTGEWLATEAGKPVFLSSGDKIKQCFQFRPSSEQSPNGRVYNERLYTEHVRYHSLKEERRAAAEQSRQRKKGETVGYTDITRDPANAQQTPPHLPPPTSEVSATEVSINLDPPPPPTSATDQVVVARNGDSQPETQGEAHGVLRDHCAKLGLPCPTPELAGRIVTKFSGLRMSQIVQYLPRFEGQNSPGLWDSRSRADLELESNLQTRPKPAQKSRIELQMERLG